MRAIRVGDTVQAFLNANITGKVVKITQQVSEVWFVGGTSEPLTMCDVKLASGEVVSVKITDLFIVDI
tara:strand:+ start:361 stop:564 length:204 start_codon:yes stop_codon:yes gene_type:complete